MPKELRDVLDLFLADAGTAPDGAPDRPEPPAAPEPPLRRERPAALPIVALPIGERDVVRAAFAWNLTVEVARLGGKATLLGPRSDEPSPLWPAAGRGPLGAEITFQPANGLGALHRAALDLAVSGAADASEGGLVLVRVPPAWLLEPDDGRALLRWSLLFSSPDRRELLETYGLTKRLAGVGRGGRVGVTIHGARSIADAERAFEQLSDVARRRLHTAPVSYGLLVDDLHVYRAIVARRPIGLERPQAPAARALRDVARLLLQDARRTAVA